MTLDLSLRSGLEVVQTEALVVLYEQLNDALTDMEIHCAHADGLLADRLGVDVPTLTLEPIDQTPRLDSPFGNFYIGHRPSLIDAPIEHYPNVCVIADRFDPIGGFDQGTDVLDRLRIEIMVKSLDGEESVNKRIVRTADAVLAVIQANTTLNGTVAGLEDQQRGFIGAVFPRESQTSYGSRWYWQGARLDFTVRKTGAHSSGLSGGFLRTASSSAFSGLDIDQSVSIDQP
jgi:hypothetical protein